MQNLQEVLQLTYWIPRIQFELREALAQNWLDQGNANDINNNLRIHHRTYSQLVRELGWNFNVSFLTVLGLVVEQPNRTEQHINDSLVPTQEELDDFLERHPQYNLNTWEAWERYQLPMADRQDNQVNPQDGQNVNADAQNGNNEAGNDGEVGANAQNGQPVGQGNQQGGAQAAPNDQNNRQLQNRILEGTMKPFDLLPKLFNGLPTEDCRAHMDKYKDYIKAHNLDDATAVDRFSYSLDNEARRWRKKTTARTMEDLEKAFIERFSKIHTREGVLKAIQTKRLKPGQSVESFVSELRELGERIQLGDDNIKDFFIAGLPKTLRATVSLLGLEDLERMISRIQKYLEIDPENASHDQIVDTVATTNLQLSMHEMTDKVSNAITGLKASMDARDKVVDKLVKMKLSSSSSESNADEDDSDSDSEADVRLRKKRQRSKKDRDRRTSKRSDKPRRRTDRRDRGRFASRTPPTCYYCNKVGHIQRNCLFRQRQNLGMGPNRKGRGQFFPRSRSGFRGRNSSYNRSFSRNGRRNRSSSRPRNDSYYDDSDYDDRRRGRSRDRRDDRRDGRYRSRDYDDRDSRDYDSPPRRGRSESRSRDSRSSPRSDYRDRDDDEDHDNSRRKRDFQ